MATVETGSLKGAVRGKPREELSANIKNAADEAKKAGSDALLPLVAAINDSAEAQRNEAAAADDLWAVRKLLN